MSYLANCHKKGASGITARDNSQDKAVQYSDKFGRRDNSQDKAVQYSDKFGRRDNSQDKAVQYSDKFGRRDNSQDKAVQQLVWSFYEVSTNLAYILDVFI